MQYDGSAAYVFALSPEPDSCYIVTAMRTSALVRRFELLTAAGTLAAHANAGGGAFRQRDVRFLIELFSNWIGHSIGSDVLPLQNTQMLRHLDELVLQGYARRLAGRPPKYRLTRPGIIEVTARLVSADRYIAPDHLYFLIYFVSSYREKIAELVKGEGPQFPLPMKLELDSLLDLREILRTQIRYANQELQKIDGRIKDGEAAANLAAKRFREGRDLMAIVEEAGRLYPYGLNSQKSLPELFSEITPDMRRWELETGNARRAELIWRPARLLLQAHLKELKRLYDSSK